MKKHALLIFTIFGALSISAQSITPEVIASGGDHYVQTNAQLSFTIGEVVIETVTATNSIITQGFHQPDGASNPGFESNLPAYLGVNIYPNPSADHITVELENNTMDLTIELFEMTGKLVASERIPAFQNKVEIDVSAFANASYLLSIHSKDKKHFATYSIQKTR